MNLEQLKSSFIKRYGETAGEPAVFFSPGRVNLIGEHTDYNNGYVLPCALTFGTYLLLGKNNASRIRLASENFEEVFELSLDEIHQKQDGKWINYPLGVIDQLRKHGLEPEGMDLLFYGNIPNSAGLSSSASIEMVTAFALNDIYVLGLPKTELVKLSQKAENEFVGVNCGIMDQFAVGMGEKDRAVFLDCGTLEYELIPLHLEGHKLVIANTNKSRGLADSKYNERVGECRKAMDYLRKAKIIDSLSDLTYQEFTEIKHLIPDITIRKRAKHVISENQRVLDAVEALRKGNLRLFGKLMNASHNSLRYDYEVTGPELDAMVEAARQSDGVRGARMTGAGFGGCTVALVQEDAVENFMQEVGKMYTGKTGLEAEFYISEIGNGTMRLA